MNIIHFWIYYLFAEQIHRPAHHLLHRFLGIRVDIPRPDQFRHTLRVQSAPLGVPKNVIGLFKDHQTNQDFEVLEK